MIRRPFDNELFPTTAWRCLLPDPDPEPGSVTVVGSGWTSEAASLLWPTHRACGEQTSIKTFGGSKSELVVADSFDSRTLDVIDSILSRTGTAYIESEWPRGRPLKWLTNRLSKHGFSIGAVYSISVGSHRWTPSWWIPVGDVEAVQLVAAMTRPTTSARSKGNPMERLRDRVGAGPSLFGTSRPHIVARRPWLLHPTRRHRVGAVIGRRSGQGDQSHVQPGLRPADERPTGVVMRIGGSSTDQPILFYLNGGSAPATVVKAPTIAEERCSTRLEAQVLAQLATAPKAVYGVPRPVPIIGDDGLSAWGQTFAPGHTLAQLSSPERLHRHAALATEWTVNLAMATSDTMTPEARSSIAREVEQAVLGLVDLPDGDHLARSVASSFERIECERSVRSHGDLGPWNVHLDGEGSVTVIDWADSQEVGLPLCDLVHFIAHLCLCAFDAYDPHRRTEIVNQIMNPATPLGRLMVDQSAVYAETFGLSPRTVDDLRTVTWALDLLGRPSYRWAEELYLELLRAEVRRQTSRP